MFVLVIYSPLSNERAVTFSIYRILMQHFLATKVLQLVCHVYSKAVHISASKGQTVFRLYYTHLEFLAKISGSCCQILTRSQQKLQIKERLIVSDSLQVKVDVLQAAETLSIQSGEGCEQVLSIIVFLKRPVYMNDHRPVPEAGVTVWPPQAQVMAMNLQTQNTLNISRRSMVLNISCVT